jgi:TetR/AcrR family transcriptional regulator
MYDKFENLEGEKQERILRAAMAEFAVNGYDKASTNAMVKKAEIAKGLLFHYFVSKKQLFLYLYGYCLELVIREYLKMDCLREKDIFIRIRGAQQAKMALLARYPDISDFMTAAYRDQSPQICGEVLKRNAQAFALGLGAIFTDVDVTLFKPGLDAQKVISVIRWTFEGLGTELTSMIKAGVSVDYGQALTETDEYIKALKFAFYQ